MTESPTTPPFGGSGVDLGERTHLRFAQITDIHVSTQRRCLPEDLREDLARILDNDELDFLIAGGDLTAGGAPEEFAAFREIVDALPIPVYTAAGNHDDDSGVEANSYQQALGPLYYSADVGPLHVVIYDGEAWQRQGLDTGGIVEEDRPVLPQGLAPGSWPRDPPRLWRLPGARRRRATFIRPLPSCTGGP